MGNVAASSRIDASTASGCRMALAAETHKDCRAVGFQTSCALGSNSNPV